MYAPRKLLLVFIFQSNLWHQPHTQWYTITPYTTKFIQCVFLGITLCVSGWNWCCKAPSIFTFILLPKQFHRFSWLLVASEFISNSFFLWDPGSISANSHSKPEIDKTNSCPFSVVFRLWLYLIPYSTTVKDNSCSCSRSIFSFHFLPYLINQVLY